VATRLFYIDDSGYGPTGWAVYGWVEVEITEWRHGLRPWLDFRMRLDATTKIPVTYEFHATDFLNKGSRPSRDASWNGEYKNRWTVTTDALDVIAGTPCLSVGAVYRKTDDRGRQFHRHTIDLYRKLVEKIDSDLSAKGDVGIVVMDGDGTADSYVTAHRGLKLATRSIIEDPMFQHSHRSQWVQIADLIAYVAYQSLLRAPQKPFAWNWYKDHLTGPDPARNPQQL
jgi:hypothetical protein